MNLRKMTYLILVLLAVGFSACATSESHEKQGEHHTAQVEDTESETTQSNTETTQAILSSYLAVKDALVASDAPAASTAAKEMAESLTGNAEAAGIHALAQQIGASEDVAAQREVFNTLSQQVYELAKGATSLETKLYKQYCPMAFNNTGAFWLAAESEVNNPYFGDMMLHCGKVEEEI